MITIKNNIIPFKGYLAMCIFPFIFVRKDARALKTTDINHETIHGKQQIEMLWVLFFLWYIIEWLIRLIQYRNAITAYKNISFEREAYYHQAEAGYLEIRKPYSFIKYINNYGNKKSTSRKSKSTRTSPRQRLRW